MRKVMKKIYILSFIAGALCLAVSCNKELQRENSATEGGDMPLVTETITATISEADSKVAIDGTSGTVTWHTGDEVAYHISDGDGAWSSAANTEVDGANAAFITSGTRNAFAVYPKSLVHDGSDWRAASVTDYGQSGHALAVTLPDSYTLSEIQDNKTKLPIIAENTGDKWTFKQLCGTLRLTVSNIPAETSYLKVDFNGMQVSGAFSIASPVTVGSSTIASSSDSTDDTITINGISGASNVTFNLPLPTGTYGNITIVAYSGTGIPLMAQHTSVKGDGTAYTAQRAHGKQRSAALTMGVFSIASGEYAIIAPGNLIYSAGTWSFHDTQYGVCRKGDGDNSAQYTSSGTFDLFGWGTSGWDNTSAEPSWTNFQPWSTSMENLYNGGANPTYQYNSYGYGPSFNSSQKALVGVNAHGDWGVHNQIGLDAPGTWCTLSYQQFLYVYKDAARGSTVNGVANAKGTHAMVEGINGDILFPDIYSHPSGPAEPKHINDYTYAFTENEYTAEEWNKMEAAGAVFLPCAGYASGGIVLNYNVYARYWTSTQNSDLLAWFYSTYKSWVTDHWVYQGGVMNAISRYHQFPVRLVKHLD